MRPTFNILIKDDRLDARSDGCANGCFDELPTVDQRLLRRKTRQSMIKLLLAQLQIAEKRVLFSKQAPHLKMDQAGKDSDKLFAAGLDYLSVVSDKNIYLKSRTSLPTELICNANYDVCVQENVALFTDNIPVHLTLVIAAQQVSLDNAIPERTWSLRLAEAEHDFIPVYQFICEVYDEWLHTFANR